MTVPDTGPTTSSCTDKNGNPKEEGDSWDEPCGTCHCVNGQTECPQVKCQGPPSPDCIDNEDPDVCCPTYTCHSSKLSNIAHWMEGLNLLIVIKK